MKQIGPVAPKDPTDKLKGFYIMFEATIAATERQDHKPSEEIYLDYGRLESAAKIKGGITDEHILELMGTTAGFRKVVKRIGVSITSDDMESIQFEFHNYGKIDMYGGGTILEMPCPCDGGEYIMEFSDYKWSDQDDVVGKMVFTFDKPGMMAKASVKLYVDDAFDIPEVEMDPPVDMKAPAYKKMISESLMAVGNNARVKRVIEKAKNGEDVTIAYIGGSITQGACAKPINTECYAMQSFLKFKKRFGKDNGDNVHFVKAGLGGTCSELGMIRYERDVLADGKNKPDLVVIEFAVNDEGDETKGVSFESLVLKCLKAENAPAVVLLFSVFANDLNLQERLAPIGEHYGLPMVSVRNALVPQFSLSTEEGRVISKRQYFYDLFHPTNIGHQIMADCLFNVFEVIDGMAADEMIEIKEEPCIGNDFTYIQRLDRHYEVEGITIEAGGFDQIDRELQFAEMNDHLHGTPQFPFNWKHTGTLSNESFKLSITSKALLLVYKDSGNADVGKANVYVDGQLVRVVDPREIGWTHTNAIIIYNNQEVASHKVEIKMAEGCEEKWFTILGFGYTMK